jgi:hypothetical protein
MTAIKTPCSLQTMFFGLASIVSGLEVLVGFLFVALVSKKTSMHEISVCIARVPADHQLKLTCPKIGQAEARCKLVQKAEPCLNPS